MTTRKASPGKRPTLLAAFDEHLSFNLQALRQEIDRCGKVAHKSTTLAALEATVARLRSALKKVSRRGAGDIAERLDELEYPIAKLQAFFAKRKTALDKRATEIMAEYVRDRLLEVRIIAKTPDGKR